MTPKAVDDICRRYMPSCIPKVEGGSFGSDTAVVTAATIDYLPGLQVLVSSIRRFHSYLPICVYDLGLTSPQRFWLERHGVDVVELPYRMVGEHITGWANYNKPFYILNNRFSRCLWIDADCVVTRPLDLLFARLSQDVPLIIRHPTATAETRNKDSLYSLVPPVKERLTTEQLPNNGVIGFDKSNPAHLHILRKWAAIVTEAALSPDMQAGLSWYDEGALQLALESLGLGHIVVDIHESNYLTYSKAEDPSTFFSSLASDKTIHHFTGPNKYWRLWEQFA